MKKVLSNTSPSKLVRKVLSRTSNTSTPSREESKNSQPQTSTPKTKNEPDPKAVESELTSLKEQISILQLAVTNMQDDAEKKEKALANIAREKQQLSIDLRKERRSISNLKQQLQDEREFYYKEKEQYCQEMNDCKKLKKKISENVEIIKKEASIKESDEIIEYKNRISKLQEALNQTLEANYNLSVKFLRMKNTKTNLKNLLKQQENEHRQAMQNLQVTVNNIKNDLADVVDKRFTLPISPSNKKYLQVIKQNGMLLYENLCLQMEVDRLAVETKRLKFPTSHKEAKRKVRQLRNSPGNEVKQNDTLATSSPQAAGEPGSKSKAKPTKHSKDKQKMPNTSKQAHQKSSSLKVEAFSTKVITIFERTEGSGTPTIIIEPQSNEANSVCLQNTNEPKSETKNAETLEPKATSTKNLVSAKETTSRACTESSTYGSSSRDTLRTQSAPEIVQTSSFVSKHKP